MSEPCGKTLYIIQGLVTPHMPINKAILMENHEYLNAVHILEVTIPDDIPTETYTDSWFQREVIVVKSTRPIEDFNPRVLVYVYGEWKELYEWGSPQSMSTWESLIADGYKHSDKLGFVTQKNIKHYNNFMKMLFG